MRFDFGHSLRKLRSSPKTSRALANRQQPATPHPHDPYPMSCHSRGHNNRTQSTHSAPEAASHVRHTAPHHTRRADRARSHGSALHPTYRRPNVFLLLFTRLNVHTIVVHDSFCCSVVSVEQEQQKNGRTFRCSTCTVTRTVSVSRNSCMRDEP